MKISVLIPVYNVEEYLGECLDSCISQDYSDVEFICVNDGSTDNSLNILREYEKKDTRIKVIDQKNRGLSGARNAGLKNAEGQWVMFLDSDDKLENGAVKTVSEIAESNPEIIVFWANTFPSPIEENPWFKKTLHFPPRIYEKFSPQVIFSERGAMPFVWRHAYSMDLIKRNGIIFDETAGVWEDVIFPMALFPDARKIVFTGSILYDYRLGRSGSIMVESYSRIDNVVEKHYVTIRIIAKLWNEKGWMSLYGTEFLKWMLKFTLLKVKDLKGGDRKEKAREMFKMIDEFGLSDYKNKLDIEGKAMMTAFKAMR